MKAPSQFDLKVGNPPIEETDIPMGAWSCHRCVVRERKKIREGEIRSPSKESSQDSKTGNHSDDEDSSVISSLECDQPSTKCDQLSSSAGITRDRERRAKDRAAKKIMTNHPRKERNNTEKLKDVFGKLIDVGEELNPVTFDIPPEFRVTLSLPGDDRVPAAGKVGSRRSSTSKRKPYELDHLGLVPMPPKLCFVCGKSCLKNALVACDFCPALYHKDCLNPPLTVLPTTKWMCPNHVQHFIDKHLWKSDSHSERVALYDKYVDKPVNEKAISLAFIRKAYRRKYRRFNTKVNMPRKKTVQVPDYVKAAYKNPPVREPSFRDLIRAHSVVHIPSTLQSAPPPAEGERRWLATPEEQTCALEAMLKFQIEAMEYMLSFNKLSETAVSELIPIITPDESEELSVNDASMELEPNSTMIQEETEVVITDTSSLFSNSSKAVDLESENPLTNGFPTMKTANNNATCVKSYDSSNEPITLKQGSVTLNELGNIASAELSIMSNGINEDSDDEADLCVKVEQVEPSCEDSSVRCLEQNIVANTNMTKKGAIPNTDKPNDTSKCKRYKIRNPALLNPFLEALETDDNDVDILNKLDPTVIHALATIQYRHMKEELRKAKEQEKNEQVVTTSNDSCRKVGKQLNVPTKASLKDYGGDDFKRKPLLGKITSDKKHREKRPVQPQLEESQSNKRAKMSLAVDRYCTAVLCPIIPISASIQPIFINKSSFYIGTDSMSDLCLRDYGNCDFWDLTHAIICHDQQTKTFTLVNFSSYGTLVDSVLYGTDSSQVRSCSEQSKIFKEIDEIKKIKLKRKNLTKRSNSPVCTKTSGDLEKDISNKTVAVTNGEVVNTRRVRCQCRRPVDSLEPQCRLEGSAPLHQGSIIAFGCLKFSFGVLTRVNQTSSSST